MHRVLSIVAVHKYWVTAELYGVHDLGIVAVQKYWVTAELYDVHNFIGANAVTNKAVFSLGCRAALVQAACTGPKHCCCATVLGYSRAVWGATSHRCKCSHKQGCFQYGLQRSTGAGSLHRS